MIKLMEWLFPHQARQLEDENTAAEKDAELAHGLRKRAERLAADGFSAGYAQAFYANDRRRRPRR